MEIIAHRGYRHQPLVSKGIPYAEYQENTIPALLGAMLQGFPVEFDVFSTKESPHHAIISHDDELILEHGAMRISKSTLNELLSNGFVGLGDKAPLLTSFLEITQHRPEQLYMELKCEGAADAAIRAIRSCASNDPTLTNRLTVSSFAIRAIQAIRVEMPDIQIAWGIHKDTLKNKEDGERIRHIREFIRKGKITEVHLERSLGESPGVVEWYKSMGCTVKVWTINTIGDARTVQDAGADGIFTDYPEMLRELLVER